MHIHDALLNALSGALRSYIFCMILFGKPESTFPDHAREMSGVIGEA
jgi:hypothetical protein